jgi:hypothetical protein
MFDHDQCQGIAESGGGSMNSYIQFGALLVASIPLIIIAVVGGYIAFARREAHPRASLLVSLGLLGLVFKFVRQPPGR